MYKIILCTVLLLATLGCKNTLIVTGSGTGGHFILTRQVLPIEESLYNDEATLDEKPAVQDTTKGDAFEKNFHKYAAPLKRALESVGFTNVKVSRKIVAQKKGASPLASNAQSTEHSPSPSNSTPTKKSSPKDAAFSKKQGTVRSIIIEGDFCEKGTPLTDSGFVVFSRRGNLLQCKVNYSRSALALLYEKLPQKVQDYIDVYMPTFATGETLSDSEYLDTIAALYGKSVATEVFSSTITTMTDFGQDTLPLVKVLNAD